MFELLYIFIKNRLSCLLTGHIWTDWENCPNEDKIVRSCIRCSKIHRTRNWIEDETNGCIICERCMMEKARPQIDKLYQSIREHGGGGSN